MIKRNKRDCINSGKKVWVAITLLFLTAHTYAALDLGGPKTGFFGIFTNVLQLIINFFGGPFALAMAFLGGAVAIFAFMSNPKSALVAVGLKALGGGVGFLSLSIIIAQLSSLVGG